MISLFKFKSMVSMELCLFRIPTWILQDRLDHSREFRPLLRFLPLHVITYHNFSNESIWILFWSNSLIFSSLFYSNLIESHFVVKNFFMGIDEGYKREIGVDSIFS